MLTQHTNTWRRMACLTVGLLSYASAFLGCATTGTQVTQSPLEDPPSAQIAEMDRRLKSVKHTVASVAKAPPDSATAASPDAIIASEKTIEAQAKTLVDLVAFDSFPGEVTSEEVIRLKPALAVPPTPLPAEISLPTASVAGEVNPTDVYPIDLANALSLGGADNLQVRIARTRLYQAQAKHLEAKTLWLPSLRVGVGYNKHDGRLQATEGDVIEANRNSLFYGGGAGLGEAPLAGGAGGPARLLVNLSLADAYFEPLSACQEVAARGAAERAATNDSLAQIAIGYHSLVEAHGLFANAMASQEQTQHMLTLVESFEREGFSSRTEVNRAKTALAQRRRETSDAERRSAVRSTELARLLRLPAQVQLTPAEELVLPIDFVEASMTTDMRIAMALRSRPEMTELAANREAACFRVKQEKWRPWIPNVQAGTSAGGFGGGPSTQFPSAAGRSDVDLLAVWELKNLGIGNVALQRQRRGELHERELDLQFLRDRIASEVVAASADVASYQEQIDLALESIRAAKESYELNEQRIRANEGLPIELLQSISALAEARDAYTEVVAHYHRAQHRLLRAMGKAAL